MPDFFAYLIDLCGQKSDFLIKTLVFGVHIYAESLITKALQVLYPKSFFAIKLKFKLHQIHLVGHELIREMGIYSSNKRII